MIFIYYFIVNTGITYRKLTMNILSRNTSTSPSLFGKLKLIQIYLKIYKRLLISYIKLTTL